MILPSPHLGALILASTSIVYHRGHRRVVTGKCCTVFRVQPHTDSLESARNRGWDKWGLAHFIDETNVRGNSPMESDRPDCELRPSWP